MVSRIKNICKNAISITAKLYKIKYINQLINIILDNINTFYLKIKL